MPEVILYRARVARFTTGPIGAAGVVSSIGERLVDG
jgi:hypothetical protein